MTKMDNVTQLLNKCNLEQLKEIAIAYKDKFEPIDMIIASRIDDKLIELMPEGEFALFCDNFLF